MNQPNEVCVGVLGGSGIYDMEGLTNVKKILVETPFGPPSDRYISGTLNGVKTIFLPRHGSNHNLLPSELNYRANIYGFKTLGVSHIIAITAVGSLQEHMAPLDIVIPDQLVDRTRNRISTYFGNGIVTHIPFADPFCPGLSDLIYNTAAKTPVKVHQGGTFVTIEGPAFSTRAESNLYRQWGIDIIGMTTCQEAKLAREAEICYAAMAMVTDYDCWREETEHVTVETVLTNLNKNAALARQIIKDLVPKIQATPDCICNNSLDGAIMTPPGEIDDITQKKLAPIIDKYLIK